MSKRWTILSAVHFGAWIKFPPPAPAVDDVSLTSSVFGGGTSVLRLQVVRHLTHHVEDRVAHKDRQVLNVAHTIQHVLNAAYGC